MKTHSIDLHVMLVYKYIGRLSPTATAKILFVNSFLFCTFFFLSSFFWAKLGMLIETPTDSFKLFSFSLSNVFPHLIHNFHMQFVIFFTWFSTSMYLFFFSKIFLIGIIACHILRFSVHIFLVNEIAANFFTLSHRKITLCLK